MIQSSSFSNWKITFATGVPISVVRKLEQGLREMQRISARGKCEGAGSAKGEEEHEKKECAKAWAAIMEIAKDTASCFHEHVLQKRGRGIKRGGSFRRIFVLRSAFFRVAVMIVNNFLRDVSLHGENTFTFVRNWPVSLR